MVEGMNGRKLRQRISDGGPRHQRVSLVRNRTSLRTVIMQEAWQSEGIDPETAGEVEQWYFPDEGLVVIDLEVEDGE